MKNLISGARVIKRPDRINLVQCVQSGCRSVLIDIILIYSFISMRPFSPVQTADLATRYPNCLSWGWGIFLPRRVHLQVNYSIVFVIDPVPN